ncbi:MAG: pyruvate kinase [Imperialibacter sp.]|uniref:pyruvate kinase n=1 Tax=Imperialibacter sp. TaxID=2038411 RepID=UPI0032EB5F8A
MIPEVNDVILAQLQNLETALAHEARVYNDRIEQVHAANKASALNLIHYLTLRKADLRPLQDKLHYLGLSSLSNSESHTLHQVRSVIQWLNHQPYHGHPDDIDPATARAIAQRQSMHLFGQRSSNETPFIMVTLDARMVGDVGLVSQFLEQGMDIARINCAHDDEAIWRVLVSTLKQAVVATGKSCRIYMDLAGPKLRTGIPGKGKDKKRLKIAEGQTLKLVEPEYEAGEKERVVSCSVRGIIAQLKPGQKVLFDDGLISTTVVKVKGNQAHLAIDRVSGTKPHLKVGKGINFPNAQLEIVSLTKEDKQALPYICQEADMVGYSFVRTVDDLKVLQSSLADLSDTPPHIIVKIETPEAFVNLPELLLQGMTKNTMGVMIARGDLAVEVGFERMSELQEEILWICEAAHVPVIWATQVLETLNKTGIATRSEATDAARSSMAECVMINKGLHTVEVIRFLKDILSRSGGHRTKRRHLFRPLSVAQHFFKERELLQELTASENA